MSRIDAGINRGYRRAPKWSLSETKKYMKNKDIGRAVADWHMYFHGVDRDDFPEYPDDHFAPKAGYVYQHDASNDEYHSILSNAEAASLLEQVKVGKKLDPQRLKHFTDQHQVILSELLKFNWLASQDDDTKEAMAFAALSALS